MTASWSYHLHLAARDHALQRSIFLSQQQFALLDTHGWRSTFRRRLSGASWSLTLNEGASMNKRQGRGQWRRQPCITRTKDLSSCTLLSHFPVAYLKHAHPKASNQLCRPMQAKVVLQFSLRPLICTRKLDKICATAPRTHTTAL